MNSETLRIARKYMRRKRIVFDMCDNHFSTEHGDQHIEMIKMADLVTCPTEKMSQVIDENADVFFGDDLAWPTVIPDPHEFNMIQPALWHWNMSKIPLLWYGNDTSLPALLSLTSGIDTDRDSHGKNIITINGHSYPFIALGNTEEHSFLDQYSRDKILFEFNRCDVVIIPQVNDWWGCVKSPNRLLEAVVRGRFVLANSIPAYDVFKEWMWIGDIAEGLEWLKQQSGEEICQRIKKAQEYIKLNHSIKTVADQWETALTSVVETTTGKVS